MLLFYYIPLSSLLGVVKVLAIISVCISEQCGGAELGWPRHWWGSVPTDQDTVPQGLSRVGRAGMVVTGSINSCRHSEVMEQVRVRVGTPVRNSRGWGWRWVRFWHRNIGHESVVGHVAIPLYKWYVICNTLNWNDYELEDVSQYCTRLYHDNAEVAIFP